MTPADDLPHLHEKYAGGLVATLRESAKNDLHSDGTKELLLDAAARIEALELQLDEYTHDRF